MKPSYFATTDFYWGKKKRPKGHSLYGLKWTESNLDPFSSPTEMAVVSKVVVIIYLYSENILTNLFSKP